MPASFRFPDHSPTFLSATRAADAISREVAFNRSGLQSMARTTLSPAGFVILPIRPSPKYDAKDVKRRTPAAAGTTGEGGGKGA